MTTTLIKPSVAAPARSAGRFGDRLSDVWALTRRNLIHVSREPMQLSDVTVQPVLFTLLFIYVFGSGIPISGGSYKDFALAGLLTLNLTTSTIGTAVGLSTDLHEGVIDRFRTLPMWRAAILVGRSISDVLSATVCVNIVALTGLAIGWRADASVPSVIGGVRHRPLLQLLVVLGRGLLRTEQQRARVGAVDRVHLPLPAGVHLQFVGADRRDARVVAGHCELEPGECRDGGGPPHVRESQSVGIRPCLAHATSGGGGVALVGGHSRGVRTARRLLLPEAHGRIGGVHCPARAAQDRRNFHTVSGAKTAKTPADQSNDARSEPPKDRPTSCVAACPSVSRRTVSDM